MELFLGVSVGLIIFFTGYALGKYVGIKETFEHLEKEGKIISKDELNKLRGEDS